MSLFTISKYTKTIGLLVIFVAKPKKKSFQKSREGKNSVWNNSNQKSGTGAQKTTNLLI